MEKKNVKVTELSKDIVEALEEKRQEAIQLLELVGTESPLQIVTVIREIVDRLLSEEHSTEDLQEYALQLGTMWGYMVEREYGWQWKYLDFGEDIKGIYLVSPLSYYCCPPLYFLNKILQGNNAGMDSENDNTVLLLFNMLNGIEKQVPSHTYMCLS